jgi:hypothetical protein
MSHPQKRRQRSTVGTIVTTAAVAYGAYRLADYWFSKNGDDEVQEEETSGGILQGLWNGLGGRSTTNATTRSSPQIPIPKALTWKDRRQRLARCREDTRKALHNLLPTVRTAIEEATNTSKETKELKRLRAEKSSDGDDDEERQAELWETIKTSAFTRGICTAYAHTILVLVLTVQIHLLGGKLFQKQQHQQEQSEEDMDSYQASHRQALKHTYAYFFDKGLLSLVQTVRRSVSHVLADWDVSDPSSLNMTQDMVEQALQEIRNVVLYGTSSKQTSRRRRRPRSLLRFLLPPETITMDAEEPYDNDNNDLSQSILDETWDLLESPVLEDAQEECLNVTFDLMRDQGYSKLFDSEQTTTTTQPLAKVIAQFKQISNTFYNYEETSPSNDYYSSLEKLPCILELGDVSFQ